MRELLLLALLYFAASCNSLNQGEEPLDTNTVLAPLDMDSIRLIYKKSIQLSPPIFPEKQIAESGKVNPVDEAPLDTAFFVFRTALQSSLDQRDVFSLLDLIDENVQIGADVAPGIASFVEFWNLDSPNGIDSSMLWSTLTSILKQGGVFNAEHSFFSAPYTTATFPQEYDQKSYAVIIGEGVRLRSDSHLNSKILTSLSYDIIELLPLKEEKVEMIGGETYPWKKVKTLKGKEGFIFGKYLSIPGEYRARFQQQSNGWWKMVYLGKSI